ncbi:MAG TPA: hypothetical protein VGK96_25980, partial [Candidatus Sulfotelmatobacter sp.]
RVEIRNARRRPHAAIVPDRGDGCLSFVVRVLWARQNAQPQARSGVSSGDWIRHKEQGEIAAAMFSQ